MVDPVSTNPPRIPRRQALGALSAAAVAASAVGAQWPVPAAAESPRSPYPKGIRPTELFVVDRAGLSDDEAIMIATLQGLLARPDGGRRQGPAIYLDLPNGYRFWLDDLTERYDLPATRADDPWALVDRFADRIAGYVLYRAADPTINVATTVAGVLGGIAVAEAAEETAVDHGLRRLADVRDRDDAWAWRTYRTKLRNDLVIEQKADPEVGMFTHQLRDYATMAGAFTFYDGNSDFRRSVVEDLDPDAAVLGWGDAREGEDAFVGVSSAAGVASIPGDWAANLACLSGLPAPRLRQRAPIRPRPPGRAQHQVAFVVTDGDNVQWMLNDLPTGPNWFASPRRGTFDVGWGVPPSAIDLAPSVLDWYYRNASAGPHHDRFVVGPSGGGYLYPSRYPRDELDRHTARLARAMKRADLGVVQILDFESFDDPDLWSAYLRHDQITGLIYLEYSRYDGLRGRVRWVEDKPVISARTMLWDGLSSPDQVIETLNAAAADPSSADGYSVVMLHCWSMSLDDLGHVVDNLAPHVSVVTPDALIRMMTRYVDR
ncbi:GxGYxYP domain-containing protein [Microlunatus speluncae]|uniref:GxGYxYP domain-containing protein n=1 Tax=Microlunatus speluncae TaxID=2594267 RepID=UPI00126661C5|nr:GxGYxYP domain-containing protein [Microlunatus speluncae]